jgi:hypothetical protein
MRFTASTFALLASGLIGLSSPLALAAPQTVADALQAQRVQKWPILGAMADIGVPDGLNASLVVRPWKWVRAYGGGGSNTVAKGWRAGLTLLPFGAGPSLSAEYGSYGEGNANGLVARLVQGNFQGSSMLDKVGYDYANAHVGLDFGGRYVTFFIHGGISRVWSTVHAMDSVIRNSASNTNPNVTGSTQVVVNKDPTIVATGSSLKLGLIIFLL